jgi:hypothetical protein
MEGDPLSSHRQYIDAHQMYVAEFQELGKYSVQDDTYISGIGVSNLLILLIM